MAENGQGLERPASPPTGMGNPARTITLSCWILGASTRPFFVDIEDGRRVDDLKEAMVKKNPHALADIPVDADQLALWKVGVGGFEFSPS
jgi:hypothetical protein